MKLTHIIAIVFIAVLIAVLTVMLGGSASTYSDFTEASQNPDTEFHVVGKLDPATIFYQPKINSDECSFMMNDSKGIEKKVILHKSPPSDIKKSEQIVIIGKMQGEVFHANEILMKCPSKYNDGKQAIAEG
jgi:cytochrome c-type biogenesis protein CcmE